MKPMDWLKELEKLGLEIRSRLSAAHSNGQDMASPVATQGGDTIFAIDRHVEPALEAAGRSWAREGMHITLIAEGLGDEGIQTFGDADSSRRWRVLIDPIDGTRNIMYDKRAAWFLAAVMPDRGPDTRLSDSMAAILLELPTSKQAMADAFCAVRNSSCIGKRVGLVDRITRPLRVEPSRAATLHQGFGQVSNFFPGTKMLAAELMERIVQRTLGDVPPGTACVFEDQYISTGGQLVELMLGRDRFCCDLRPLFYQIIEKQTGSAVRGLECHPYDMAGWLVARQAGVALTDGWGRELDIPLNVHSPVHWCGYANASLRSTIEPVITQWLWEKGIRP